PRCLVLFLCIIVHLPPSFCNTNDWSPEDSSEEDDGGEDKNCDVTWKKSQRLAKGLMKFSTDLLREVQLESNSANVILSPLSITLALSHLALGNLLVTKAPAPALPSTPIWRY
uniref:Serpin domain-containing protein n=1 Tax=Dromaius novaehollandiae TaxID=8790 RepID=A0A8C4JR18_DRONO